jgi:hypothetical protein
MNLSPKKVYVDDHFHLFVEYSNGEIKKLDLTKALTGSSLIKNIKLAKQVFLEDGYAISWPNGISIDPEHVYQDGTTVQNIPVASSYSEKITRLIKE